MGDALVHYPSESRHLKLLPEHLHSLQAFLSRVREWRPGGGGGGVGRHFQYEDEEGDRVWVRSDEEMEALARQLALGLVHVWPEPPAEAAKPRAPPPALRVETARSRAPPGLRVETGLGPRVEPLDDVACLSQALECSDEEEGRLEDSTIQRLLSTSELRPERLRNLCVLGAGQCGTVYKAVDTTRDRLMACKCVSLELGPEQQAAVLNELRVLHKAASPFILSFYGALLLDAQVSICMEFMDGGSLETYGALPPTILGCVAVAAVEGLGYLWSIRVMHRDLKPSNLLVNSDGRVKVGDFGVSAELERSIAASFVGTKAYMAPERVMGGEYRVASDVWALGVTLAELALGRFPFPLASEEAGTAALLSLLLSPQPVPLPDALPADAALRGLLAACLHKAPQDRPSPQLLAQQPFLRAHSPFQPTTVAHWIRPILAAKEAAP